MEEGGRQEETRRMLDVLRGVRRRRGGDGGTGRRSDDY